MLKGIKAVLFDLDGTLLDSMGIWQELDKEFVSRHHLKEPEGFYEKIEGMSFVEISHYYAEVFPQLSSPEEIRREWTEMIREHYRMRTPLKPGAREFLDHLKKEKIRMGIATSNEPELARTALQANGVLEYFDAVCSACDVACGKPAPDVYLKAASELGVQAGECLVFEDIPNGILAGKRAGMRVCAVEDVFSAASRKEKQELADHYIKDFFEILEGIYG